MSADHGGHVSRDAAHRREQRERTRRILDRFVGDRRRTRGEECLGQFWRRASEVEVGEQDLAP